MTLQSLGFSFGLEGSFLLNALFVEVFKVNFRLDTAVEFGFHQASDARLEFLYIAGFYPNVIATACPTTAPSGKVETWKIILLLAECAAHL